MKFLMFVIPSVMIINKLYRGTFLGMNIDPNGQITNPIVELLGLPYDARPRNTSGFVEASINDKGER